MKTDVSEKGLEDIIVDDLTTVNGYELGKSDDFDAKFAVDWPKLHGFLLKTQPVQAGELRLHEEGGKLKFLTRLNHEIESRGIVDVLRKGIKCYPVHLTLMYATPTETNASCFAFTATPKNKTLEMFGARRPRWQKSLLIRLGLDGVLQAVQGERRLPRLASRPHVRAGEGNRRGMK